MITPHTFLIMVLQVAFHGIVQSQAALIIPSASWNVDMAANEFVASNIVGRNLVVDGSDDNGNNVSHNVLQAIVVVLVLFLLFLFALFLFRKHRFRRLRQRWQHRPSLRVVTVGQTFDDSSAPLMSEIPMTPPPPAASKNSRRNEEWIRHETNPCASTHA